MGQLRQGRRTRPEPRPATVVDPVAEVCSLLATGPGPGRLGPAVRDAPLTAGERVTAAVAVLAHLVPATDAYARASADPLGAPPPRPDLVVRLVAELGDSLGPVTPEQAALLGHALLGSPGRSGTLARCGGLDAAVAAAVDLLDRLERATPDAAGAVAALCAAAQRPVCERDLEPEAVSMRAVQWWLGQRPGHPVRLEAPASRELCVAFDVAGPVSATATLAVEPPARVPPVVAGESLLAALADAPAWSGRPARVNRTLLVPAEGAAPPVRREAVGQQLEALLPARAVPAVLRGRRRHLHRLPAQMVQAAQSLRPFASTRDVVSVVSDPGNGSVLLVGDKFVLAAPARGRARRPGR